MASKAKILLYSFVCLILTYYISVLAHEYSHATMAWIFGYKKSPFDILYGSWYLMPVSENVDYQAILASSTPWHGGLIGIAGIGMTVILFFLSLFFLDRKWIKSSCFATIFFFWLGAINVMEMFTYVPNRVFIEGDITEFYRGFSISPFWIFIPGTVLVLWALYRFYSKEVHKLYALFRSKSHGIKRCLLYSTFWPLVITFIYWVIPKQYVALSFLTNIISILVVIYLAILADPKYHRSAT